MSITHPAGKSNTEHHLDAGHVANEPAQRNRHTNTTAHGECGQKPDHGHARRYRTQLRNRPRHAAQTRRSPSPGNRSTPGYAATDTAWATLLDTALDEARFTHLRDLYHEHHAGNTIGYGPAVQRLTTAFDAVKHTASSQHGDARTEYDLLRKARISLRFGKLNHCMFDENNPAGSKCIENATIPDGHHGPLIDRCQPGRCANSIITTEHLPIWQAEHGSILTLLDTPKLAPCRRDALQHQLHDVEYVINRGQP